MQVYPAYTVERIEAELSWREFGELSDCWKNESYNYKSLSKIEKMLAQKFGFTKVSSHLLHGDELLSRLTEDGEL